MSVKSTSATKAFAFIGKKQFFWFILVLLVLQAAWIAASGQYPMAFDENFHLGIIKLYAHHISPFWSGQPPGANSYSAVARDPSYLYQYLMSFPFRLISLLTNDQTIQIMVLRALNIMFFVWGLFIYRQLLAKIRASSSMINISLLIFVLLPVTPLLAAQINYDNLFLPLVGLALLWALGIGSVLEKERRIDTRRLLALAILCVLTSLVKYAFLPIFVGICIYLAVRARKLLGSWREVWLKTKAGLSTASKLSIWLLSLALVLSCLLFVQRYGVNIVRYHNPVPDCSRVLGDQACMAYGPWARDHGFELAKTGTPDPIIFIGDWFYGMWFRLFFAVAGPTAGFETRGPLLLPAIGSIFFAASGLIAAVFYGRRIFKKYDAATLYLLASAGFLYVAALWLDNLGSYMKTGQPVAINGRYLLPFLLPLILVCTLAIKEFCRARAAWLRPAALIVALVCMIWGGGVLTFILRSDDDWYWPNPTVRKVNGSVRRTVGPWTPGYYHPDEFMGRHGA